MFGQAANVQRGIGIVLQVQIEKNDLGAAREREVLAIVAEVATNRMSSVGTTPFLQKHPIVVGRTYLNVFHSSSTVVP
jgi:hypothetical protein